jgi:hypothetical protein
VAIAATLIAIAVLAVVTSAGAATKPFSLVVSPSSFAAGSTTTVTATLTNLTDQQQLGSANITAPAGFSLVSASVPAPATVTTSGQTVLVRNASLAPHNSLAVSITVKAPCSATSSSWSVVAKQANDFNGQPGNDLNLNAGASSLSATVGSGCSLRFFTQPHHARVGQTITGSDYAPSGSPVAAEVVDGQGNRVTSSSAAITLALGPTSTGTGTLHGTKTVTAVAGVASFGDLSIDTAGAYTLLATSPGITSATSSAFRVDQTAVACTAGLDCTGSIQNNNVSGNVTAFSGLTSASDFLALSLDSAPVLDCAGYTELSPDWIVLDTTSPNRTKSATLQIPKRLMNSAPNNGAPFVEFCFGATGPFAVKPGFALTLVHPDVDGDGTPDNWYEGLLPDCSSSFPAPCVTGRHKTGSGDGVITARLPAGTADPHMRG